MAWLSDWSKRIEITVDNTNIDGDLTHFPVPIVLGTSVGQLSDDVSAVFDELTSGANRKKIAITKSDGTTQIYVEIETWDDANEAAVLWVSKSDLTITSGSTTTLYLYYDSSKADNTIWVGDTGDSPAQDVWDSNFKFVNHANESSGNAIDSTLNGNDGIFNNNLPTRAAGKISYCQNPAHFLDGITVPDIFPTNPSEFTFQAWGKTSSTSQQKLFEFNEDGFIADVYLNGSGAGEADAYVNGPPPISATAYDLSLWHLFSLSSKENGYSRLFIDGTKIGEPSITTFAEAAFTKGRTFANGPDFSFGMIGHIDEMRISDIQRSNAWQKVDFYAQNDDLLTFGAEETPLTAYKIYGEVRVNSVLSNRKIRIYNRSTGNLIAKAYSVGGSYTVANSESGVQYSGEFISGELISGEYYQVVCISNLSGEYSSDIVDRVKPEQYIIS